MANTHSGRDTMLWLFATSHCYLSSTAFSLFKLYYAVLFILYVHLSGLAYGEIH